MSEQTVAILSPGDMGSGIARLLIHHNIPVITNVSDRSKATQDRATAAGIKLVSTDIDLVDQADIILSIVPPRDAHTTAQRILTATQSPSFTPTKDKTYIDLNAISPASARKISTLFTNTPLTFIDSGIIGSPPKYDPTLSTWRQPRIPTSGPHPLSGKTAQVLQLNHISPSIGSASGLKMCFAALSKGFGALAIQSFTTAYNLGVLGELEGCLEAMSPGALKQARGVLPSMPPKAYRWVHEMEEIAGTFEVEGGFAGEESPFRAVARVYEFIAEGTELGREVTEDRKRGETVEDVVRLISEGTERRKVKTD